ncbi:hypothetical protein SAMN02745220_00698 [Desulfopila aestuarii DSM 18488]|uniref:Uncharacterized protein n=1 Tax=Desulfopila aestuarii DSM 18488 TaxID=1121416 RepID=A0A1M7XYQ5_9BACT|nr:hypothetical protein [Desulfopila aestuarii]SHO44201.1 hypothetical protein SAMN02745220_00698 [Desulfopila aestuarii DSM 18488]
MKTLKILGVVVVTGVIMTLGSEVGEWISFPGSQSLVPTAAAIVGRPLTPVSVAGVARRTVRRCAVGVYHCRLPGPPARESVLGQTLSESIRPENIRHAEVSNQFVPAAG